jgi:plasmid maintenance system antidote protein VapI
VLDDVTAFDASAYTSCNSSRSADDGTRWLTATAASGRSLTNVKVLAIASDALIQIAESRMTSSEFRWCLESLGLSEERAARLLSIKQATIKEMALGKRDVTANAKLILRLLTEFGISIDQAMSVKR